MTMTDLNCEISLWVVWMRDALIVQITKPVGSTLKLLVAPSVFSKKNLIIFFWFTRIQKEFQLFLLKWAMKTPLCWQASLWQHCSSLKIMLGGGGGVAHTLHLMITRIRTYSLCFNLCDSVRLNNRYGVWVCFNKKRNVFFFWNLWYWTTIWCNVAIKMC